MVCSISQALRLTISIMFVLGCFVQGQRDYSSDEFYMAFPKNGNFLSLQIPKLHLTTNEQSPVKVNITSPLGNKYFVTVPPHGTTTVEISHQLLVSSNTQLNKGIHIKTEGGKKVSVYATNYIISSAGGFAVLPLHTYDNIPEYIYYAFSTKTSTTSAKQGINSIVLLVSGFDDTVVSITPTQTISLPAEITNNGTVLVQPGKTYTLSLKEAQSLLLSNSQDMSGTKIVSNKPLSVISGHECGIIPPKEDSCDHMVQQIPPSVTWGKVYMSMPFAKRDSGSLYKIIPAHSNTNLTITCSNTTSNEHTTSHTVLAAGEVYSHSASSSDWCSFVGNKSILVTQYALGGKDEVLGDPLSMALTPVEQYTDLRLGDILVPTTPFVESSYKIKENIIGIFVRDIVPTDITLDDDVRLNGSNWQAIYSGDTVLGYGLSIKEISESSHFLSGSLSESAFVSVVFYGFTEEFNGFGYPVNGAMDAISKPWFISFVQENYTLSENGVYQIPVESINGLEESLSLSVQTCHGVQPIANVEFDDTLTVVSGEAIGEITVTVMDDKDIEEIEMFCLELVSPQEPLVYLSPITQADIYIEDDEELQLSLHEAQLTKNNEIQLTLELSGYEGETSAEVTVDVNIAESLYHDLKQSTPLIPSFTMYFTKYLRETKYLIPLHDEIITGNIAIYISVAYTELNVTSNEETVPLQLVTSTTDPIASRTLSSSSQSTPAIVSTTTSPLSPTSSADPTVMSTQPPTDQGLITAPSIENGTIKLDIYILYLIIGLIGLLGVVVLALIVAVVCFYKVSQRKYRQNNHEKGFLEKDLRTNSKSHLLPNANCQSTSTIRFSDSPPSRPDSPNSDDLQNRSNSASPAVDSLDDGRYSVPTDLRGDESSPRHSMNGSKDNLLQIQNTTTSL